MRKIAEETHGEYMFLGLLLTRPSDRMTVPLEIQGPDGHLGKAFELAGQGKFSAKELDAIGKHQSVAYLYFSASLIEQRDMIISVSELMRQMGGIAVKVDSTGKAHSWDNWLDLLRSENPADWYSSTVLLVGGEQEYYSCGMHHFGMADVEVPRSLDIQEAAYLMNKFNVWRLMEETTIETGQFFSAEKDSARFTVTQVPDKRHAQDNLFHNPAGLWRLEPV